MNWKPVSGYEGLYEVSDTGIVIAVERTDHRGYHRNERTLQGSIADDGSVFVLLSKNGRVRSPRVHQLVAREFVPNPNGYKSVYHKDGNKLNNHAENLKWGRVSSEWLYD